MKHLVTLTVTFTALFCLNACSKSASDTLTDALEDLIEVSEKSDLTPAQATKALIVAAFEIEKVTEMAKKDPEKVKKEIDALENTEKGELIKKAVNSRDVGKLLEIASTDPKGRAAATGFLHAFMQLDATCRAPKSE